MYYIVLYFSFMFLQFLENNSGYLFIIEGLDFKSSYCIWFTNLHPVAYVDLPPTRGNKSTRSENGGRLYRKGQSNKDNHVAKIIQSEKDNVIINTTIPKKVNRESNFNLRRCVGLTRVISLVVHQGQTRSVEDWVDRGTHCT